MLSSIKKYVGSKISSTYDVFPNEKAARYHLFVAIFGTTHTTNFYYSLYIHKNKERVTCRSVVHIFRLSINLLSFSYQLS